MSVALIVKIPDSRRLTIEFPREVPVGPTTITITPVSDLESDATAKAMNETEFLMQSSANRIKISQAIENIERGENIVWFENIEQAIQCAKEWERR